MPLSRSTRRAKKWPLPGPRQCHPRVKLSKAKGSCIPQKVILDSMAKLGLSGDSITLAKHLGVDPKDQRTFLNALPLEEAEKAELARLYLRPAQPAAWKDDPDMWLDSNNIKDVMKQYEEARPDFKFLGPYPIDFAAQDPYVTNTNQKKCLISEMCELDLDGKDMEGKDYIGIVYNLDPHYKNGSHWVANFINIKKKQCYYFDSYGMKPPKQIEKFMQWLSIQEPDIKLGWNGRRFQRSNTECGMFSMYFIDRMLAGEPYLKFCRSSPPDSLMLELRSWMFST
jgi:hypothetical protein